MKIYLGADHRGFELKEKVKTWISEHEVTDMGAYSMDPDDDYTLYAEKVASLVSDGNNMGILLCGSGVGVCVAANKFDGVRAAIAKSAKQVEAGRADDNMNILVLAADYTTIDEAQDIVASFLNTKFSGLPRHERRLKDISRLEANN